MSDQPTDPRPPIPPNSHAEESSEQLPDLQLDGTLPEENDPAPTPPQPEVEQPGMTTAEETEEEFVPPPESSEVIENEQPPPAKDKPANLRWDMLFLLLLCGVTLLRLGYLYIVPLDLGPDESYYWDWSRRLDLGYFSKPPMIAWVNALTTALLGHSAVAVRLPAVVLGALGLIGLYLCGRRMYNAEVGFWAVAAWLAAPGTAALGLIMATDVLLVCCWSLALYTLWRAVETPQSRIPWWLLTMVLVGLGSLSKQMMMIFPLLLILFLLSGREDRGQLKRRWPWLLWLGSLLFLLPPLWWNFRHGWITFKHTAHHIEPVGKTLGDHLLTFGEFAGSQLGLLSPITWLLLVLLLVCLLPGLLRWSRQTRFLFIFGGLGLLAFIGLSFKQSINPNWPVTFYPALLLLLAAWARGPLENKLLHRLRRWFIPGVKLGVVLALIAYLLPFVAELSFIPLGKRDPFKRIKGWQELALQVDGERQQQPRPEQTFFLSPLRKYPAEIAFYTPGQPITYKWPGNPPVVSSQYDLWPGPVDKLGWDALLVNDANSSLPDDLVAAFANVVDLGERRVPIGAGGDRVYHLWLGENLQIWPEAR